MSPLILALRDLAGHPVCPAPRDNKESRATEALLESQAHRVHRVLMESQALPEPRALMATQEKMVPQDNGDKQEIRAQVDPRACLEYQE